MNFWSQFDAAALRFPERAAIEVQKRQALDACSYRDLHTLAQTCAAWLAGHGVEQGDRCAILAHNDVAWCAAYFGILRLGAVAVPLDTNCSAPQLATILDDVGVRALFADERLAPLAQQAAVGLEVLVAPLASFAPSAPAAPEHRIAPDAPFAPVGPDAPAVIFYTPGTTTDPKGVLLTHANLAAARDAASAAIAVSEHDSILGVVPLFHAFGHLTSLLLPLGAGARVLFIERLTSGELLRAIGDRGVTIVACLPQFADSIHRRLLEEVHGKGVIRRWLIHQLVKISFALRRSLGINVGSALFAQVHARVGKQLRFFVTGGARLDPAISRDFYALGLTMLQTYGLTETAGAATITQPDDADVDTVGRPLPGQQVKILPSAAGIRDGEVAIRGPIVMQAYYNRPDDTRDVFDDGWLLTGDLGHFDDSGRLALTGKRNEVIHLANGSQVDPEPIEAQYRQSQFVHDVCVLASKRGGEPSAEGLYAVVVPDEELLRRRRIANAGDLLRFEMEGQSIQLPRNQRVLGFEVWFEGLPRTTTGKLKRRDIERRLHAAATSSAEALVEQEAHWPSHEQTAAALAIIRARAAGRPVRRDANLELDLGLDSLDRVELLSEVEARFGVRVDREHAHEIFTVQHLLDALGAARAGETLRREPTWSVLLDDDGAVSEEPAVRGLLERRSVAVPAFFALSRVLRLVLGPRTVYGREHLPVNGPYIITPNHQGYLDPFIICAALPFRVFRELFFVGAAEYFESRLSQWLARKINLLPVDPDANLLSAMQASAFGLKRGKILVLFPEGERSIDGTVKRFKKGTAILAQHLDVPVVPVAIRGSFELWPRNRAVNWRALLPLGHRVRVAFGPPIRFAPSSGYGESASQLRDAVVKMWEAI